MKTKRISWLSMCAVFGLTVLMASAKADGCRRRRRERQREYAGGVAGGLKCEDFLEVLADHENHVARMTFSDDENLVLTASDDCTAKIWSF